MKASTNKIRTFLIIHFLGFFILSNIAQANLWPPQPRHPRDPNLDGTSRHVCDVRLNQDGLNIAHTLRHRLSLMNRQLACLHRIYFNWYNNCDSNGLCNQDIVLQGEPLRLENHPLPWDENNPNSYRSGVYLAGYGTVGLEDKQKIRIDARALTRDASKCAFVMVGGFLGKHEIHGITILVNSERQAVCDDQGHDLMNAPSLLCQGSMGKDCELDDIDIIPVSTTPGGNPPGNNPPGGNPPGGNLPSDNPPPQNTPADVDHDGVPDTDDKCSNKMTDNAYSQTVDLDSDGQGDACDSDMDGDGLSNIDEVLKKTNVRVVDTDGDGKNDQEDSCPLDQNAAHQNPDKCGQDVPVEFPDADSDGKPDRYDNCMQIKNPLQANSDDDEMGDACDPDDDNDGVNDLKPDGSVLDNCQFIKNPDQKNENSNMFGDACDGVRLEQAADKDGDGLLDEVEKVIGTRTDKSDTDDDGLMDGAEYTTSHSDPKDPDTDGDGICDGSQTVKVQDKDGKETILCQPKDLKADNCPLVSNPGQEDENADGQGDACEDDEDGDGKSDSEDNCPFKHNPDQKNDDKDDLGNACDPNNVGESKSGDENKDSDNNDGGGGCSLVPGDASTHSMGLCFLWVACLGILLTRRFCKAD